MSDGDSMDKKLLTRGPSNAKATSASSNNLGAAKPLKNARPRREYSSPNAALPDKRPPVQAVVQKSKAFTDKRPRSSGFNPRLRNQVTAELSGNKSRKNRQDDVFYAPKWASQRQRFSSSSYNKEHFLQASCQFLVDDGFDYSELLKNPDRLVEWENIQEIRVMGEEWGACPICLYPPVAAKMTRCGHMFCWSCLLHYLSLSDKRWRKCPICFESVYGHHLKSVKVILVHPTPVQEEMELQLMCRRKGTTVPMPVTDATRPILRFQRVNEDSEKFSKVVLASALDVRRLVIARERAELELQLQIDRDQPESVFLHQALQLLDKREEALFVESTETTPQSGLQRPDGDVTSSEPSKTQLTFFVDAFNDLVTDEEGVTPSQDEVMDGEESIVGAEAAPPQGEASGQKEAGFVFFYQATDGQQTYLHPVSARCLLREFGSLEAAPPRVLGRVLQLDRLVMEERVRDRFRYLSHLPLSTGFALVELQFPTDFLSPDTVQACAEECRRREKQRQKRAREEQRQSHRAMLWDRAMLYNTASKPTGNRNETQEIPFVSYVASAQKDIEAGLVAGSPESSPPTPPDPNLPSVPSFAQMLRSGKPKTTPETPRPTPDAAPGKKEESGNEGDQEEAMPAPSFNDAFGDALTKAFENLHPDGSQDSSAAKKKKKGKTKGTVLFSTGTVVPHFH